MYMYFTIDFSIVSPVARPTITYVYVYMYIPVILYSKDLGNSGGKLWQGGKSQPPPPPPLCMKPCIQCLNDYSLSLSPSLPPSLPPSHLQIIPALLAVLDDFSTPRVQTHAGAALVNFFEQCSSSILSQYLDTVVPKLENVLLVRLREVSYVRTYMYVHLYVHGHIHVCTCTYVLYACTH